MDGPGKQVTLRLRHLGQGHHLTYNGAEIRGPIAKGELIEATINVGEPTERVIRARITEVNPTETRQSRSGDDSTGPLIVYATEVPPQG
jgi:hypothetical protein